MLMQDGPRSYAENFFDGIGLDEVATDRVKQLALLGRLTEINAEIATLEEARRTKRGAPRKPINKDRVRASRILGMAEMAHRLGFPPQSTRSLIDLARQAEDHLAEGGHLATFDFRHADFTSIEKSVSRGLQAMQIDMEDYRSNPAEFFIRFVDRRR
jgi:hypothetical protein